MSAPALLPARITPLWIVKNRGRCLRALRQGDLRLDCSGLTGLGSLGAAFLSELHHAALAKNRQLVLAGMAEPLRETLRSLPAAPPPTPVSAAGDRSVFYNLGDSALALVGALPGYLSLFVEAIHWSTIGMFGKKTMLRGSTTDQMILLGSSALPITLLLSFLIGLTLAIQSAVQLEQFGASVYLAAGIGISMVTEIGPMMTAVICAGRSGSAITAEIATMSVQEELKALQAMAVNPVHFLLLPRFRALTITLPLLTVCADAAGVVAGFLISYFYLGIPSELFFQTLLDAVTITMFWQSMLKAVTFGWLITLIAVRKGMLARGGSGGVGRAVTSCVVTCIFCIILADAAFSFLFYF